jgi:hypothetical protein
MGGGRKGSGRNRHVSGREEPAKKNGFRKIMYGGTKSGRLKEPRKVGKEGSGKGSEREVE